MSTLWGCGGESSSTVPSTVSGVASTGAAIVGTVELQDSKGVVKSVATGTNGGYSIVVDGLTAPYLVKASNPAGVLLYSFAAAAGTVNVNPFTNVALVNAFGTTDLTTYYNTTFKTKTDFSAVKTSVTSAATDLKAQLSQANGLYSKYNITNSADFFNGTISIGQGVDKIFDDIKVTYNGTDGTITMTNSSNNTTFMTISRGTTAGSTTYTVNSANYPQITTTVTQATCDAGYIGATATTTGITLPGTCGTITYCANAAAPTTGGYYLIGGKKIVLDLTKYLTGTTVNTAYAQQLGLEIATACGGI
jgi:hypothetical protein